jgi:DNA-binding Lrp family transcriptional regulator
LFERIKSLDETDSRILRILQENCRVTNNSIAKKTRLPKSTIQYRIKRLEKEGIIEGYHAQLNSAKIGKDYMTITFVQAKYGKKYYEKVGRVLAQIPGVFGVYFLLGEHDFVVLCNSDNREDFMKKLDIMYNMEEIERSNTTVVMKTIKVDYRTDFGISNQENK